MVPRGGGATLIESRQAIPIVQLENRRCTFLPHEREDITASARAVARLEEMALNAEDALRVRTGAQRRGEPAT